MHKPKVILTRTESNPHRFDEEHHEIEWIDFPLIKFDYQNLTSKVLDEINANYDWLVFTSQNGAKSFFEQARDFPDKFIACVGPKTAEVVEEYGYTVDFIPSIYTSLTLAKEIPVTNFESTCYVGGNLSSSETIHGLKERSRHFKQVESYHTVSKKHELSEWKKLFYLRPEMISFCSPSAVTSYVSQLKEYNFPLPEKIQYAAIGTTTAQAIKDDLGMTSILGEKHTFASMIDKIVETFKHDS